MPALASSPYFGTHWLGGGCPRSSPPAVSGFSYILDGPLLGIPAANGRSQALLSAHLGYGTSLLTGLPAFSLSQSQLLLHTAARVSSLKHKPERVIPPLKGQAPHCPWDRRESMPENRSPSTWSVLFYLSKVLLCPLRLGSGLFLPNPPAPSPYQESPPQRAPWASCFACGPKLSTCYVPSGCH